MTKARARSLTTSPGRLRDAIFHQLTELTLESKTRLPASRSSSVGPEGCFSFCHPKVKGGGVSFDKNENRGLEMHFKCMSF